MSGGSDDLWRMIHEISDMPYGAGQIAAVEQLIRRVDADGDEQLRFVARLLGTNAYIYGGEPVKSFVTFSWCVADFDRNPQPYHQRHGHTLLWYFKNMVNAMLNFPEVPLERTYAVLDDMERRYREGGHSLQPVYKYRHRVAQHRGMDEEAAQWYRKWTTTARGELSDCAGCDPSSQVWHLAETGRDEEAVALAEPVLAGRLSCNEQPQTILTQLLLPYLRTGRREAAREAHQRAYRLIRGNLADLADVGTHVEFCGLTGNEARGLEIVERHLDWLDRAPSPAAAMEFASAAVQVLRRLAAAGHGGLTVHRRAHGDRPAADVPLPVLAEELAATATEIAARFDARNGTSAQSQWVARRMVAEPVGEPLPLSPTARRRAAPAPVTEGSGEDVFERRRSHHRALGEMAGLRAREALLLPDDAAGLLEVAEECWRTDRQDDLLTVLRAFDERFGEQMLAPSIAARRVELRAVERSIADDLTGARELNRTAIELFQQVPDPIREQVVTGRLGALLCMAGEVAEGLPLVQSAAAYLAEHGDAAQRASADDRVAMTLLGLQRPTEALVAADRATSAAAETDDPFLIARVSLRRGLCLLELDRRAEAREVLERAREGYRELGQGEPFAAAGVLYGRTLDDPADAVLAYDEALAVATAEVALNGRIGRAQALLAIKRTADAVDDYVEAVAICAEQGLAGPSAHLRLELANAYRLDGRMLDAAEVAEEAMPELERLGFQGDADRCRHLLATIYRSLGEDDLALTLLEQLANNLDGPDNLGGRAQILEEAGDLLYRLDRDGQAAQRFAVAAEAYGLAGLPLDELRARRREADALYWSGDVPAAVASIERADKVAAALPSETVDEPAVIWERAMLANGAARVLVEVDRPGEALVRLDGVAGRLRSIDAFGEALQVELIVGEVLLRLDRPAEAEPVLRSVLPALPIGSDAVRRAAWLLSRALSELGRSTEAEALRAEHDLESDD